MKRIVLAVGLLTFGFLMAGCAFNSVYWTPPPPTVVKESDLKKPAGAGQDKYLYYYQREVYYNLDKDLYTWLWKDAWRTHPRLPWIFRSDLGSYVVLDLPEQDPQNMHEAVLEQFPRSFPIQVVSSSETPPSPPAVPLFE